MCRVFIYSNINVGGENLLSYLHKVEKEIALLHARFIQDDYLHEGII